MHERTSGGARVKWMRSDKDETKPMEPAEVRAPMGDERALDSRKNTARGLGSPPAQSNAGPPAFQPGENDSVEEMLGQLVKKQYAVPVSFEAGRTEHAEPRRPPKGHDTLPMQLPVVVDVPTDPGKPRPANGAADMGLPRTGHPLRLLGAGTLIVLGLGALVVVLRWPSMTAPTAAPATLNAPTSIASAPIAPVVRADAATPKASAEVTASAANSPLPDAPTTSATAHRDSPRRDRGSVRPPATATPATATSAPADIDVLKQGLNH